MKAIILAAGKGSRLDKFTKKQPKCLLKLGRETILAREIRLLQECDINEDDIYVVGGYKQELLKSIAPNLIVNSYYDTSDNSYSLGFALEIVDDDDIVVMDADLCFEKELLQEVLADKHKNLLLSMRSNDTEESTGIVEDENENVVAIGKQYSNTGFVYLSIFKAARETISDLRASLLEKRNAMTWYPSAITEICNEHIFYNKKTNLKWHEIDYIEDYYETIKFFNLGDDL